MYSFQIFNANLNEQFYDTVTFSKQKYGQHKIILHCQCAQNACILISGKVILECSILFVKQKKIFIQIAVFIC